MSSPTRLVEVRQKVLKQNDIIRGSFVADLEKRGFLW